MGQIYLNSEKSNQQPQVNKNLAAEFEALKAKPVERAKEWTIVNLRLIVGCGCGGGGTNIHIAVPGSHPGLNDDIIDRYGERVNSEDIQRIQRNYPGALVMEGHAPVSGVTDSYNSSNYSSI